jgi:hypothetical protein
VRAPSDLVACDGHDVGSLRRPTFARVSFSILLCLLLVTIFTFPDPRKADSVIALIATVSQFIWLASVCVLTHQSLYRIASLRGHLPGDRLSPYEHTVVPDLSVVLLYLTKDDFSEICLRSCVTQDYPSLRVIVSDDSELETYRERIDRFVVGSPECCKVVRRGDRAGYKAGNINFALRQLAQPCDWFVLVDADQRLPPHFVTELVIQGVSHPWASHSTLVARTLSAGTEAYFRWDLPAHESAGLTFLLGHGALVSYAAWLDVGGFPEVVSEDYAFTFRAESSGWHGRVAWRACSDEGVPETFGAFSVRTMKYAGATAELLRREFARFLRSSVPWQKKYDAIMQVAYYPLAPALILNGFLTAVASNQQEHSIRNGLVSATAITLLLAANALAMIWVSPRISGGIRMYLTSYALVAAVTPLVAWRFVAGLVSTVAFDRTPKNGDSWRAGRLGQLAMILLGVVTVAVAVAVQSNFSLVLGGLGVAYATSGLYERCDSESWIGMLVRLGLLLPGTMATAGAVVMWGSILFDT